MVSLSRRTKVLNRPYATDDLRLWLPFREGSGITVQDFSGHGNTGTIHGPASWVPGKIGSYAVGFNGTTNHIDCGNGPTLDLTTDLTIEMWAKFASFAVSPCLISKGGGNTSQFWMDIRGAGTNILHGGYTAAAVACYATTNHVFPLNEWVHIAWTYDKIRTILYVDGAEVANVPKSCTLNSNADPVRVGCRGPAGQPFSGSIDEVRIYARALTPAEIARPYAARIPAFPLK